MPVVLNWNAAASTTTNVSIELDDGGSFELLATTPMSMSGSFACTALMVTTNSLNFTVASGASFQGTLTLPVAASQGAAPSISVENIGANSVTVQWPTKRGLVTQELTPGTPMTLTNFIPDSVTTN